MAFFDPLLHGSCRTMVCRNTPHPSEFCDREEKTMLIDYSASCASLSRKRKPRTSDPGLRSASLFTQASWLSLTIWG